MVEMSGQDEDLGGVGGLLVWCCPVVVVVWTVLWGRSSYSSGVLVC